MSKDNKKSASERLDGLEETALGILKALTSLSQEQETIKEAIRLLSNKLDVVVQLQNAGKELSADNISVAMVQNKADQLERNTAQMVQNGLLVKSETVNDNSFVVGREVMDDGNIINPRIQFVVNSAQDSLKAKLLGAKVLDKILVEEGKAKLELLEIYSINEPQAPQAPQGDQGNASQDAALAAGSQTAAPDANAQGASTDANAGSDASQTSDTEVSNANASQDDTSLAQV